jgi:hypothetical protein
MKRTQLERLNAARLRDQLRKQGLLPADKPLNQAVAELLERGLEK